ncbi:MAG: group II intron reverse transcriptase/maturase, partial [Deltaproteobacteria bacterium]|nr:group II intron reverse transcriptase/maturase [Deltaproteobacteria bacterium]
HEEKTRLIEFGRFTEENRRRKGRGRPEVFDFLGFTHYCGKTRDGRFLLCQKTQRKRAIRKLKELRQEMRRRMHQRLGDQHRWLAAMLRGHYAYFGIPGNSTCLDRFRLQAMKAWRRVLLRRSQRPKLSWERFNAILKAFPIPLGRVRGWRHQMA